MINKRKSLLLCLFFGWLGVHRFYERKFITGILYMCTFGIFGIGWVLDLWDLSIIPNKPITESYQYNTYLKVVEALQKNGYDVNEYINDWCEIRAGVYNGGKSYGYILVIADPTPGFISAMIGAFFPGYKKYHYEATGYGFQKRFLRNSYHYWPDDSLVVGVADTDDTEWLNILKTVIG